MEHSTKWGNEQIFLAVHKEQVDAQDLRANVGIGIVGKWTRNRLHLHRGQVDAQDHRSTKPIDKWTRSRPHRHRAQDHSQKPHVTKNRKHAHTRSTQDPQRPKTRKVACRAGFMNIRHTRSTRSTKTTWPCGSSHACGYLGGYSLYFYIILYIYKSKCE